VQVGHSPVVNPLKWDAIAPSGHRSSVGWNPASYTPRPLIPVGCCRTNFAAWRFMQRACRGLSGRVGQPMTLVRVLVPASPPSPLRQDASHRQTFSLGLEPELSTTRLSRQPGFHGLCPESAGFVIMSGTRPKCQELDPTGSVVPCIIGKWLVQALVAERQRCAPACLCEARSGAHVIYLPLQNRRIL
jgi:hypothetical protein